MITIIIPNYNGEKFLKTCLDSIFQHKVEELDVIVIDNGSEDNSIRIIQAYKDVRLFRMGKNTGFSAAVNLGIEEAKSELVILLNNDTEVDHDWVTNLIQGLEGNPDSFAAGAVMLDYYRRDIIDDAGDYFNIFGWAFKGGLGINKDTFKYDKRLFSTCAGAAIYRKSVMKRIGLFDEDFFAYLEDVDIGFRANLLGYKNYLCPEARVFHIGSATSGSKYNTFKVYLTARNSIFLLYKNMPLSLLLCNSPFVISGFFVKLMFFAKRGMGLDFLKGTLAGLKGINKFKDKRKAIMKSKNLSNLSLQIMLVKNTIRYVSYYLERKGFVKR